jgi:aspartate/methionine/tyrosine aminotransferase
VSALKVVEKLQAEHRVLLVPGEHFGMPGYLRFGYGNELGHFQEALAETERGLKRIFTD